VVNTQLSALLEHEPVARLGEDAEGVHQMRVATRRLRAGLKLFAEVLPAPDAELRSELGWLADHLGAVRDVDVQLESLREVAADLHPDSEVLAPVLSAFEARRSAARQELVEALDGPRYAALVAALSAVVAMAPSLWPGQAQELAAETLPELLRGRYRRFRKATRHATSASPAAELHRARIRGKQLRYSLEFAQDVYGKQARSLAKRIVTVQDVLGAIQDAAVMDQRLRGIAYELPAPSVFLLGQLAQRYAQLADVERDQIEDALDGIDRRWRRLRKSFPSAA
jgi:triphosphatase